MGYKDLIVLVPTRNFENVGCCVEGGKVFRTGVLFLFQTESKVRNLFKRYLFGVPVAQEIKMTMSNATIDQLERAEESVVVCTTGRSSVPEEKKKGNGLF